MGALKLKPGAQICVVASRGDVLQMHVRRINRTKSELMGGKVVLIQYAPTAEKLPVEVEGTVLECDRGITWDLGWEEETMRALAAAAALAGDELDTVSDIDLTAAVEGMLRRPVH